MFFKRVFKIMQIQTKQDIKSVLQQNYIYRKYTKRIIDLVFAIILLLALSPIMALAAMIIKIEDPKGPILFKQERAGKGNKPFTIFKFRSMIVKRKEGDRELSDAERMLKTGNLLRKLSIDELPQLFNIVKGEMSFIGPRPLPVSYLPYYTDEEIRRHDIRPGVSGWAQVNGRNYLSWEKRFEYDIEYMNNANFLFDVKIFLKTLKNVFARSDIAVRGIDIPDESLHKVRKQMRTFLS